jgi:hypothetical protein
MASGFPQDTIAAVRNLEQGGKHVLEWRPRLIGLILVLVLVGVLGGLFEFVVEPMNWEW